MQIFLASVLSFLSLFSVTPQEWRPFSSAEGRFSISMPEEPKSTAMMVETERGKLLTHIVSANDKDLNEYMVSWTEYNSDIEYKATEKTFDRMRDALIQAKEGKLINESMVFLGGRAGRAFSFNDSNGRTVNVRFYFIGRRSYQVVAECRAGKNLSDVERFIKSFTVQD